MFQFLGLVILPEVTEDALVQLIQPYEWVTYERAAIGYGAAGKIILNQNKVQDCTYHRDYGRQNTYKNDVFEKNQATWARKNCIDWEKTILADGFPSFFVTQEGLWIGGANPDFKSLVQDYIATLPDTTIFVAIDTQF